LGGGLISLFDLMSLNLPKPGLLSLNPRLLSLNPLYPDILFSSC
jgi:hypothetical protein